MAYANGYKEQVRRRIVRSARRLFNRAGCDAVSIDEVMAEAGLTRGAFYYHFDSKAQLYREALAFVVLEHPAKKWIRTDKDDRRSKSQQIVDAYLSIEHLDGIDDSCPLVTHAAEAARSGAEAQSVIRSVLLTLVNVLVDDASVESSAPSEGLVLASLCVGGLSLARSVGDGKLAREILTATRRAAHDIVKTAPANP